MMKIRGSALIAVVSLLALLILPSCGEKKSEKTDDIKLWPEIEPFHEQFLKVSDIHDIKYRMCGNPDGIPVFVLHGGPGAGCYPYYRRFFNPEKYFIFLHDQRGCGLSRPSLELKENTTWDLVDDIEKLRVHIKVDKMILFGGSWGTTLALAYAEKYPEHVLAMVLRGVFLATEREMQHYYYGGTRNFFPEAYDRLDAQVAEAGMKLSPASLFQLIHEGDAETVKKYSIAWVAYEGAISRLQPHEDDLEKRWEDSAAYRLFIKSMALIENYYMANKCFLEEGQLLDHADRIADIPTYIINGRYDNVCPPISAYLLHLRLPESKLIIVDNAGHSMSEPPIEKALLKTMVELEDRFDTY